MPANPLEFTPASLDEEVRYHIAWMTGFRLQPDELRPAHRLKEDLRLTAYQRRALSDAFLYSARRRNPEARISPAACEQLKTVEMALALVREAAQGSNG